MNRIQNFVWYPAVIEPAEVLAKIKAFFLEFAAELFQRSRVLDIPVVADLANHLRDRAGAWYVVHEPILTVSQGTVNTQHGPRKSVRALFAKQGQGAAAYTRVVAVLGVVHEMLVKGKTAPQQDIFYRCSAFAPAHLLDLHLNAVVLMANN